MENNNKKPEERFVNHKSMIVKSEEGNDFLKRKELEEMRISCVYGPPPPKYLLHQSAVRLPHQSFFLKIVNILKRIARIKLFFFMT